MSAALFVGGSMAGELRDVPEEVDYYQAAELNVDAALYVAIDDSPPPASEEMIMRTVMYRRSRASEHRPGRMPVEVPIFIHQDLTTEDEVNEAIQAAIGKTGPLSLDILRKKAR